MHLKDIKDMNQAYILKAVLDALKPGELLVVTVGSRAEAAAGKSPS